MGFEYNLATFTHAVEIGNLDIMKWLKEIECEWNDVFSIMFAIDANNLENLKWLLDNGCKYNEAVFNYVEGIKSRIHNYSDVIKILKQYDFLCKYYRD